VKKNKNILYILYIFFTSPFFFGLSGAEPLRYAFFFFFFFTPGGALPSIPLSFSLARLVFFFSKK